MIRNNLLALYCLVLIAARTAAQPPVALNKPPVTTPINAVRYIERMGVKFDCYFTFEWNEGNKSYLFNRQVIPKDDVTTLPRLIEWLHNELPDFEVVHDAQNPVVIHLRASFLKRSENQVLDEKIAVQYEGAVRKLPNLIGKRTVSKIVFENGGDYPSPMPHDWYTKVKIRAKDQTVRSILSNYLPFSRYCPLLWIADLRENAISTQRISFFGPTGYRPYDWDGWLESGKKNYAFSAGRNAYFLNPLSDKLAADAVKFATDGFASGKTLNVRWSLYYLGKHKVESAVPLLLEHLDYRYTTVPVLAEAYPAVHALLDMGKPATVAVQERLKTETDPLRLELLCAVLCGIHGDYEARQLVTAVASKLPEAREKPILDALNRAEEEIIAVPPPADGLKPAPDPR